MLRTRRGFTLIELIVVIVVIAVLATVAVVAHEHLTDRARLATAEANLHQVTQAVLARTALTGSTTLDRALVMDALTEAGHAVTDGLHADGWVLLGADDTPAGLDQIAVGFAADGVPGNDDAGTRAALVASTGTHLLGRVVDAAAGTIGPVIALPAGTTPAHMLQTPPETGTPPTDTVPTGAVANAFANPSFEAGTHRTQTVRGLRSTQVPGPATSGDQALQVTVDTDDAGNYNWVGQNVVDGLPAPGEWFGVGLDVKHLTGSQWYRIRINYLQVADTPDPTRYHARELVSGEVSTVFSVDGNYQRFTVAAKAPEEPFNLIAVYLYVYDDSYRAPPQVGSAYLTDSWVGVTAPTKAEALSLAGQYVDGDTPGHAWSAAPHTSVTVADR